MPSKILIVDDEPHIVELVRVCLEDASFELLEANDGETALMRVREGRPDLVLLDVMIPRVDGYEVCRRLKADPETRDVPIVMLTAKGLDADRQKGREVGADGYIAKPFSPMKLLAEVQELLQRRSAERPAPHGFRAASET